MGGGRLGGSARQAAWVAAVAVRAAASWHSEEFNSQTHLFTRPSLPCCRADAARLRDARRVTVPTRRLPSAVVVSRRCCSGVSPAAAAVATATSARAAAPPSCLAGFLCRPGSGGSEAPGLAISAAAAAMPSRIMALWYMSAAWGVWGAKVWASLVWGSLCAVRHMHNKQWVLKHQARPPAHPQRPAELAHGWPIHLGCQGQACRLGRPRQQCHHVPAGPRDRQDDGAGC